MYSADLAFVHDAGFGDLALRTAPEIVGILHAHAIREGRIVEFGCGSGITARHLTDAGFDVVGIDASPAMIAIARDRAPLAQFRALIGVGEVISYVRGGMPALRRTFGRMHEALAPSGLLLFDFMESAARRTYRAKSGGGDGWAIVSSASLDAV